VISREGDVIRETVNSGDVVLAVELVGQRTAPAIVLCQGLGMRIADWPEELIQKLSEHFFVVIVENRDTGCSSRCDKPYTLFDMAADIECVTAHLGLGRFALLGFSMGGMIAQIVASRCRDNVSAFIQVCSSAGEPTPPLSEEAVKRFEITARGFASEEETAEWLAEDIAFFAAPQDVNPIEAKRKALEMVQAGHSAEAFARQYAAICGSGDRSRLLRLIAAPALIIAGGDDCCIPVESSRRAASLMPHSKFHCLENTGHTLGDDAINLVLQWLADTISPTHQKAAEES
jgi:proline iminopeptidase